MNSFALARERALQYATRWLIEDFHKTLETGLEAKRLQLHTVHRLFAAVALLSVVALALVDLHKAASSPEHQMRRPDCHRWCCALSSAARFALRARPIVRWRE